MNKLNKLSKIQKYGLMAVVLTVSIMTIMTIVYYTKPIICRGTNTWSTKMTYKPNNKDEYFDDTDSTQTIKTKSTSSLFGCGSFTATSTEDNQVIKADVKNKAGTISIKSPGGQIIYKSTDISAEPIVWISKLSSGTSTWTWNIHN
jgi:hypothetical protein